MNPTTDTGPAQAEPAHDPATPAPAGQPAPAAPHKVDQGAQDDAAQERKEGGYT